jgi:hypothetical protein
MPLTLNRSRNRFTKAQFYGGYGGTGTVTSVTGAGGGTGLTLVGGPAGAVTLTLGGTLAGGSGGTGKTSWVTGSVPYASSSTALNEDNTKLFYDSTSKALLLGPSANTNVAQATLDVEAQTGGVGALNLRDSGFGAVNLGFQNASAVNWGGLLMSSTGLQITAGAAGNKPVNVFGTLLSDNYMPVVNVKGHSYGAVGDGVTNDTTAFANAIAALNSRNGGILMVPDGTFLITPNTLTITAGIIIVGAGQSTFIKAVAGVAGPVFKFSNGASTCNFSGAFNMMFTSADLVTQKTMIQVLDASRFTGGGIASLANSWMGNTSIGLDIRGRQEIHIANCDIFADQPYQIGVNPNFATLSFDHSSFDQCSGVVNFQSGTATFTNGSTSITSVSPVLPGTNSAVGWTVISGGVTATVSSNTTNTITLTANWTGAGGSQSFTVGLQNPTVKILDGLSITNAEFSQMAWVGGVGGILFSNSTQPTASQDIVIRNCRSEQAILSTGYGIDFGSTSGQIQGLKVMDCQIGGEQNGVRLRKVLFSGVYGLIYGGTGTYLSADSACQGLVLANGFRQTGSSISDSSTGATTFGIVVGGTDPFMGVATMSPQSKLDVNGTLTSRNSTRVSMADATSMWGINGTTLGIRAGTSGVTSTIEGVDTTLSGSYQPLAIGGSSVGVTLSGVQKVWVNSTGVGIGATPSSLFHVQGNTGVEMRMTDAAVSGADWRILPQTGNTTKVFRIIDASAAADRFNIDTNGKLFESLGTTTAQAAQIGGVVFTQTADSTTTANTLSTLFGTGSGSLTLPANLFVAGRSVRILMGGWVNVADGGAASKVLNILIGGGIIATASSGATWQSVLNAGWIFDGVITCRTTGVSGTILAGGELRSQIANASPVGVITTATGTSTVNTTTTLAVDVQYNNGNATGTIRTTFAIVDVCN